MHKTLKLISTRGACKRFDVEMFFPRYDSPSANAPAIAICSRCPVKPECLEWAMEHDEVGVWGGTGEADRRALQRKRSRISCIGCGSQDVVEDGLQHEVCVACGLSWPI